MRNRILYIALLAIGLSAVGCAQDVGDIDRTQANLLPKSIFQGKWFVRQTVTDVPTTSSFSFIGMTGDMEMIRWEFQEGLLVGYRAYEQVPGSDNGTDREGAQGDEVNPASSPIVAYPVEYVDVIRDYNPRTGEQTNVISENSSDRQWNEREWVRVDWASPQVNHWFFLSTPGQNGYYTSASTFVQGAEGGEDAFRVCHAGDETCTDGRHADRGKHGDPYYLDFTERQFVDPSVNDCILDLYLLGPGDCSAQEVRVRTSFLKVDEEREADFVPVSYDDKRQGEFGFFRTERITYDRRRGPTHEGVIYLANVHDMWQGSVRADGTEVPYAERGFRPVNYALTADYPEEMRSITEEIYAEYDTSFKRTAATRRGQTIEQLEADIMQQTGDTCLFCLDANEDGSKRIGDLRYNFIGWVNHQQAQGPLGYGPSSAHPETGRIVAGMAYVYGAAIDTYASYAKDIVDLLNGDLVEDDLAAGDYIRGEIETRRLPTDPRAMERFEAIDLENLPQAMLGAKPIARLENIMEHGLPDAHPGWTGRRMEMIQGTPLESMLINEEITRAFNRTGEPLTEALLAEMSPLSWSTPEAHARIEAKRRVARENNLWLADFSDPSIVGLAQEVKDMGLTGDPLWQYLREQIYKGVMLHEIGHTVGLRHNFGASADPLNYFDEYWPLREQTINAAPSTLADLYRMNCKVIDGTNSAGCRAQQDGKMAQYQYASIMDYGGKFNSDFHGLGKYDHAAIAAGYGNLVEVFPADVAAAMPRAFASDVRDISNFRNPLFGQLTDFYHHTRLPGLFGGSANLARREWIPREDYNDESGAIRVPYVACFDEYVGSTQTCRVWDTGADAYEIAQHYINYYKQYWIFNNFQRDRLDFDPFNVYQRVTGRYFMPLQNLYQHWIFDYTGQGTIEQLYSLLGAQEGLQMLSEVMSIPRYGSYELSDGEYQWRGYTRGQGDVDVMPGDGRRAYSTYDLDAGYNIFNRILESGSFWEQYGALFTIISSDASSLGAGADVNADFRAYSIPYYLVFDDTIDRLFSGIIRHDYDHYAPRIDGGGQLVYPDFLALEDAGSMPEGNTVDLNTGFTIPFYAVYLGTAALSTNFDLSFAQRGQIARLGSGETITPAPGFETVTYEDPFSGRVYGATRPRGDDDGIWWAAAKVQELNEMKAEYEAATGDQRDQMRYRLESEAEDMEIYRGFHELFGSVI